MAGTQKKGYWLATIGGRSVPHHLIAFVLSYGRMPNGEIDHINGDRTDNRLLNIRECTRQQNNANRRIANSTGFIGVCSKGHRFEAKIRMNGKLTYIGTFRSAESAARARDVEALRIHGEFARLNFPQ